MLLPFPDHPATWMIILNNYQSGACWSNRCRLSGWDLSGQSRQKPEYRISLGSWSDVARQLSEIFMLGRLFVIFAVVPVLELYVLIKLGKLIGAWETVAMLLAVSFAGAWLVRHQGFSILMRIQGELASGRLPAAEL